MKEIFRYGLESLKPLGLAALLFGAAKFARAEERVTDVVENITSNITRVADWQPEFMYGVTSGPNGTVTGTTSGWYEPESIVSNVAVPISEAYRPVWSNVPSGMENNNPLVFTLDDAYTNVVANFALKQLDVNISSTYTNWFGTNTIGNPVANPSVVNYGGSSELSIDKYVADTNHPGRRLRFKEFSFE